MTSNVTTGFTTNLFLTNFQTVTPSFLSLFLIRLFLSCLLSLRIHLDFVFSVFMFACISMQNVLPFSRMHYVWCVPEITPDVRKFAFQLCSESFDFPMGSFLSFFFVLV